LFTVRPRVDVDKPLLSDKDTCLPSGLFLTPDYARALKYGAGIQVKYGFDLFKITIHKQYVYRERRDYRVRHMDDTGRVPIEHIELVGRH